MVEKAKANEGASVAETGKISGQSSLVNPKTQWDQSAAGVDQIPAQICQDNSPENGSSRTPAARRGKKPAEKQDIGEHIGRQLRSVYNDVLAQPVPDRFLDLLRTLEKDHK